MSLAERRRLRLVTLTALFFAQGVPWGFFAVTLPAYLANLGMGTADLARVTAMSYWPYVFKWLGGPLIDTLSLPRFGRRRPWIVLAQAMMAASVALLLMVDDVRASFDLLLGLILLHTTFNALQNVATDALAIDLLDPSERGRANGLMYGAKYAGGIVGGAGLSTVVHRFGLHSAIVIQIVVLVAIGVLPALVRERSGPPAPRPAAGDLVTALRRAYRLRSPWLAAATMLAMMIATGLLSVVAYKLFIGEHLWTEEDWGQLAGGYGLAFGFAGSLLAGALADRLGYRTLVAIASLVLGITWTVFGLMHAWTLRPVVYAVGMLEPFAQSILIVALWSLCMSVSIKRTAATQFAAYTSLTMLSIIVGSRVLAPALADYSYTTIYLVAGVLQIAMTALVPFVDPEQVHRALPAE